MKILNSKILVLVFLLLSTTVFFSSCSKEDSEAKDKVENVAGTKSTGNVYVGTMAVSGASQFVNNEYTVNIIKLSDNKIKIKPSTSDADEFEAEVKLDGEEDTITFTAVGGTSTTGLTFTKNSDGKYHLQYGHIIEERTNAFVGDEQ